MFDRIRNGLLANSQEVVFDHLIWLATVAGGHKLQSNVSPFKRPFAYFPQGFREIPGSLGYPNAFAQNAKRDTLAILNAVQRPINVKCIKEKAPAPAWKIKPSWFLVAEDDRMIPPSTQRFMAERMKASIATRVVDHTPSITAPGHVLQVLTEAARATLRRN